MFFFTDNRNYSWRDNGLKGRWLEGDSELWMVMIYDRTNSNFLTSGGSEIGKVIYCSNKIY